MPTQRRKKLDPSPGYSRLLQQELDAANDILNAAQHELYRHVETAKLGEYAFEQAREKCYLATKEVQVLEKEMERVNRALKNG